MTTSPLVTVIIPTYNHAHYLRDALSSLCAQTFIDWEAVVINNFSEDDTVSVVESFADSRIRLVNFSNHGVIASSRNHGIALARGRYLAFLDSDDIWYPAKLTKCLQYLNDGAELFCHGLRCIGEEERDLFGGPPECATFESLLYDGCCITPSATILEKQLVERVGCFSEDVEIVTAEDYHLWIKLARAGVIMHFDNEIMGEYRVHSASQSSSVLRHMNAALSVAEEFFPKMGLRSPTVRMRIRRRYCLAYYGAGRAMQKQRQYGKAWGLLLRAIRYWPIYPKIYLALMLNFFSGVGIGRR